VSYRLSLLKKLLAIPLSQSQSSSLALNYAQKTAAQNRDAQSAGTTDIVEKAQSILNDQFGCSAV